MPSSLLFITFLPSSVLVGFFFLLSLIFSFYRFLDPMFLSLLSSFVLLSFVHPTKYPLHHITPSSFLFPPFLFSPGRPGLCQIQWWWTATSWLWGRWTMLSTPPSSARSRTSTGPTSTRSPPSSSVSPLTHRRHTHTRRCVTRVKVCTYWKHDNHTQVTQHPIKHNGTVFSNSMWLLPA